LEGLTGTGKEIEGSELMFTITAIIGYSQKHSLLSPVAPAGYLLKYLLITKGIKQKITIQTIRYFNL